jgi:tRNA 2-thiocytidine biosynthesis protein TtcA
MSYIEKEIRKLVGKAIHQYGLIADKDRILVAVSGGKDSLAMLKLLHERRARVPIDYELKVLTVDLGYEGGGLDEVGTYVRSLGIEFVLKKTNIGEIAHSPENRENACFLCTRLRRKLFFEIAEKLNCNKLALGHTRDDIIETFLLNVLYGGEISTMIPRQELFGGGLYIIRPLALVPEGKVRAYSCLHQLPEVPDGCPTAGTTKRRDIKFLLQELDRRDRRIKSNIFAALSNINLDYMLRDDHESGA